MKLNSPGWQRTLSGADFSPDDTVIYTTKPIMFDTPGWGILTTEVTLIDSTGAHKSTGVLTLDLRFDWRWTIVFEITKRNPIPPNTYDTSCVIFPVDSFFITNPRDSLYIVYSGHSIKHPIEY